MIDPATRGIDDPHVRVLLDLFRAAVGAADPLRVVPPALPPASPGRTVVVGAGKAAARMARAVESGWDGPLSGLVVTAYGHAAPCTRIEVVEAGHPVPDEAGIAAAEAMLGGVRGLGPDDLVLCLLSGGGSSLAVLPSAGLSLAGKQEITRRLLACGATISEINCVRRHLSRIKGGRLAAAAFPAPVVTLAISDVPGDDPAAIASGPTVADPTTCADATAVMARHGIPDAPAWDESCKPGDPRLARAEYRLVASPRTSLDAAARTAREAGYAVLDLGDRVEGEAREVAAAHAALAIDVASGRGPVRPPCVLLSGGETTVTVRGPGRGGRNTEYALSLALALGGLPGACAIACGTDGLDGTSGAAGAVVTPDTLARCASAAIDPRVALDGNDSATLFDALGALVRTGPTGTNVSDFRAILIEG